jgi:glycosyltransferase involved in cell wall biosynthesis
VLQKRCVMAADAVLCISEATRQDVQEMYHLSPDRLHVAHLACSDIFKPFDGNTLSVSREADGPFFLYVGSRAHYKNFDGLITAYSRWQKRRDVRLLFVGSPWTQQEQRRFVELGIQDTVDLVTEAQDGMLCALYNQALAFVYPSLYEGFGIPLLEAMACGCPVIASRIPSSVEVAGEYAIYFDVGQEDSLIGSFDTAFAEGRKSPRTYAGLEHVKEFSWDKTALDTLGVYRSLT